MRKLLLIPTVAMTTFLVIAFAMPSAAAGAVSTLAPGLQRGISISLPTFSWTTTQGSTQSAGSSAQKGNAAKNNFANAGTSAASAVQPTSDLSDRPTGRGHGVGTAGQMNCGRYGNGFHGGKHDFVCPNRPFPAPAS